MMTQVEQQAMKIQKLTHGIYLEGGVSFILQTLKVQKIKQQSTMK